MFSPPSKELACGMFNTSHLISSVACALLAILFFIFLRKISDRALLILTRAFAIFFSVLEIAKIIFKFAIGEGKYVDHWMPLFFCSLFIYALLMCGFGKGMFKKIGCTFLTLGSTVAGAVFLIFPTTSLPDYPIYHFISIHSMLFHTSMILIGLIYIYKGYVKPCKDSFVDYVIIVGLPIAISLVFNPVFSSNLMIVSNPVNIPVDFVSAIYELSPLLYKVLVILLYLTVPYFGNALVQFIIKKFQR